MFFFAVKNTTKHTAAHKAARSRHCNIWVGPDDCGVFSVQWNRCAQIGRFSYTFLRYHIAGIGIFRKRINILIPYIILRTMITIIIIIFGFPRPLCVHTTHAALSSSTTMSRGFFCAGGRYLYFRKNIIFTFTIIMSALCCPRDVG